MRAPDGLARGLDHRDGLGTPEVAGTLQAPRTGGYRFDADGAEGHLIIAPEVAATLTAADGHHGRSSPRGDGAENLLVAGLGSDGPSHASGTTAPTLRVGPRSVAAGGPGDAVPIIAYRKATKAHEPDGLERWEEAEVADVITPMTVDATVVAGAAAEGDPLLPVGLDGHRYRLTGNGLVAPLAEWLGWRLRHEQEGQL